MGEEDQSKWRQAGSSAEGTKGEGIGEQDIKVKDQRDEEVDQTQPA